MAKAKQAKSIDDMRDGNWWTATKETEVTCPRCGDHISDWPMVCYYIPEWDHGQYNARKHPGWPMTRWLANWQDGDEWEWQEVVTEEQVKRWMVEFGPFDDR